MSEKESKIAVHYRYNTGVLKVLYLEIEENKQNEHFFVNFDKNGLLKGATTHLGENKINTYEREGWKAGCKILSSHSNRGFKYGQDNDLATGEDDLSGRYHEIISDLLSAKILKVTIDRFKQRETDLEEVLNLLIKSAELDGFEIKIKNIPKRFSGLKLDTNTNIPKSIIYGGISSPVSFNNIEMLV